MECFEVLARDGEFQRKACGDELHQIFLHQAVLSALLLSRMEEGRIRILPSDYNYPYNLHGLVPQGRRARALNDLVSVCTKTARSPLIEPMTSRSASLSDPGWSPT